MASKGYGSVKGRRMRATRLDGCGRVVYGDASQAVSKGFVSVAWEANTLDTDEINQTNAAGERCIYEPAETEFVGYTMTAVFCEVDPELFSLITGQRVYLDENGDAIGFTINSKISLGDRGYALEVWAGSPAADACTDPTATGRYGYFLAPYLKGGYIDGYTVENGAINFTIAGARTRDGNQWGSGPYNVMSVGGVAAPLLTPLDPDDHKLLIWVTVAPPEPFYGTRPVMDPDATPITAVVAAEGAGPTEAAITFTGASTAPVYVEFGDGTWDYVEPGTAAVTHVYAANGTYTIRATSNGTVVTTDVVIPFP
jgi:hypothetical protein